jgi:probable HAF family extracellular repeat protein
MHKFKNLKNLRSIFLCGEREQSVKKLIALSLFLFGATANAVTYNISVLGTLGGDSTAYAMNDNGQVVGQSYNTTTGKMEATIWTAGVAQSLGVEGLARGINNGGTVVGETGSASLIFPDGYAFSWTSSGGINNLGTLGGSTSGAYDINEAGVITGFAWPAGAQFSTQGQGFIYENGTMTGLGTVSSPTGYSRGHGINDSNEIVGRASQVDFGNSDKYTTYWDADQNLTQFDDGSTYGTAEQINNNGLIVGAARTTTTGTTIFAATWDTAGDITILNNAGAFGGKIWSVNDAGVLVGYNQVASGNIATNPNLTNAVISLDGENLVDLNTLVDLTGTGLVSLAMAYDINANGDIVGLGVTESGEQRAFLLTAVPVPAAVWLFGSALGLLGWMRRRATV